MVLDSDLALSYAIWRIMQRTPASSNDVDTAAFAILAHHLSHNTSNPTRDHEPFLACHQFLSRQSQDSSLSPIKIRKWRRRLIWMACKWDVSYVDLESNGKPTLSQITRVIKEIWKEKNRSDISAEWFIRLRGSAGGGGDGVFIIYVRKIYIWSTDLLQR